MERRREAVEVLSRKVLQLLVSDAEKYFLWSAESGSSIFDFGARRLVRSAAADEKPTGDRWNGIWNVLNFSKKKKASLVSLKQPLIELKDKLQETVKEFIEAKNNLLAAAGEVSSFFQEKVLTLFRFKKTLGILHWIDEVFSALKVDEERTRTGRGHLL